MWRPALALTILATLAAAALGQLPPGVERVEFPRPAEADALVFAPDGTAWAGSYSEGDLFRRPPGGAIEFVLHLPFWGGVYDMAAGPGGLVWVGARHYLALLDPGSGNVTRWTDFRDVKHVLALADGSVWLVSGDGSNIRVVHMAADGSILASFPMTFLAAAANLAPDDALWLVGQTDPAAPPAALRVTDSGFDSRPVPTLGSLHFAGGTVWLVGHDGTLVRLGADMVARSSLTIRDGNGFLSARATSDPADNVWIRATYLEGNSVVMRLVRVTPDGTLTRFAALPGLPRNDCNSPNPGDIAVTPDGRIATTDWYPSVGFFGFNPCSSDPITQARSFLTTIDPALLPVAATSHHGEPIPALGALQLLVLAVLLTFVAVYRLFR